eukprot:266912-Prymnesium_polylepis.1
MASLLERVPRGDSDDAEASYDDGASAGGGGEKRGGGGATARREHEEAPLLPPALQLVEGVVAGSGAVAYAPSGEASLCEGAPLTDSNKARVVLRVVQHRLVECRAPELLALCEGFHTVPWRSHLALFGGEELQVLMCGASRLDAPLLWRCLEFDGRTRDEIREWLRLAVFGRGEPWRKRLLRFVTGHLAMPRGGLARKISVKAWGEAHVEMLPRASTCALALFLPPYPTQECFDRMLNTALDNTAGFWLA